MKCPECGFENRPDARFCKQCGHSLSAQEPPKAVSTASGVICPACGATAKPGARYCPRCGKVLSAAAEAPSGPKRAPAQASTQPAMPPPPGGHTRPSDYAQPPTETPPPAPPTSARRGLPGWIWWVVGMIALLCLLSFAATAIVVGPRLLGDGETPSVSPSATESPPPETSITEEAPPGESATEAPAAPPPTAASTEAPPTSTVDAQVEIATSVTELAVGESVSVTVTLSNTGSLTVSNLRYQLIGEVMPYLETTEEAGRIRREVELPPGGSDTVTFTLLAIEEGKSTLQAYVFMDVHTHPRSRVSILSEMRNIAVNP